jgi:hypothetical protein
MKGRDEAMTQDTRFFVVLIEVNDFSQSMRKLVDFKKDMQELGNITVIDTEQTNYDFLYNSLIEKANKESKEP